MTVTDGPEELDRLRDEVAALRARVDRSGRRGAAVHALRRVVAAVLAVVAAFGLVAVVVGGWTARTLLDTDRWVAAVAPLPRDPQVSAAVADYATTEVFQLVDVEQRLRTVLPDQAAFVAGPLTGQVQNYVRNSVTEVLRSDGFQRVWTEVNRRAHQQAIAILERRSQVVAAAQDEVRIDLLPLINEVLRLVSDRLPTLFGRQLNLPALGSGEIPAGLRTKVQDALGVTLPANFAQFTVYDGGQLAALQRSLVEAKRDLALLVAITVVAFVLMLVVSPTRRRTLLQFGVWLAVAAVAVTAVLRATRHRVVAQVPEGTYRNGVDAAVSIVTASLRERGAQVIWLGLGLAVIAYLVGPGRFPVRLRHAVASAARWSGHRAAALGRRVAADGPGWIARHLDAVRIAGVVVAAVAALLLSSWAGLAAVAVATVAYELIVTAIAKTPAATRTGASPRTG